MTVTKEQARRILGMKDREVKVWDGRVMQFHDGTRFAFEESPAGVEYKQLPRVQPDGPLPRGFVAEWTAAPGTEPAQTPDAPSAPAPVAESVAGSDVVPAGTAKEVLAWVGGDPDRAAQALAAEEASSQPRSVLVGDLKKLVAS